MAQPGAADGVVEVPVDEDTQGPAFVVGSPEEGGLVVVGKGTVDDAAVDVVAPGEEGGKVVGDAQHVLSVAEAACGHDASFADAVVVQRVGNDRHLAGCQTDTGGEVVVFVQDAFAEAKAVFDRNSCR